MSLNGKIMLTIVTVVKDDFPGFMRSADSILSQLNPSVEWLIIDGSKKQDIAKWYKCNCPIANVFYHWESPSGIYQAMNSGVTKSRGDWIWFVNAGDFLLNQKSLSRVVSLLDSIKKCQLLVLPVLYLTPSRFFYTLVKPKILLYPNYRVAGFHHQGVITARAIFESIGGFDTNLKFAADGKFLDFAISRFECQFENVVACGFSMGGSSMTNYALSLKEAMEYRPISSSTSIKFLTVKNRFRAVLLRFEGFPMVAWYLKKRHRKTLNEIVGLDHEFFYEHVGKI